MLAFSFIFSVGLLQRVPYLKGVSNCEFLGLLRSLQGLCTVCTNPMGMWLHFHWAVPGIWERGPYFESQHVPSAFFWVFWFIAIPLHPIQWNEICFTRGVLYVVFAMGLKYVKGFPFSKPTCNCYFVLFFWCCCNPSASIQWVTLFLQEGFGILFGIGMEYVEGVTIFKANM